MGALELSSLTLSHFRSHKWTIVETDGRPLAIYGPNGAGKTNILEAISMLSPGRGLRRATPVEMARAPENLGWKIQANLTSLAQTHEIETACDLDSPRSVKIDSKTAPQIALGRIARIVWLVPVMDRLWVEGAEGRRRFLDRIALSFNPAHAEATVSYEKAMRERNRMLKDQIRDPAWYRAVEAQMAQMGVQIHTTRLQTLQRLQVAQEDAETAFPSASLMLSNKEATPFETADDFADALDQSRGRDMAAGRTLIGPHRADLAAKYTAKDTDAKLCSTGEQKALLVSLVLANSRALAQDFGAPPILLLDEVAAHLDSDRRAALYDEICTLKAQAWMTGTGAELFTSLGDRAKALEVTEESGLSVVTERSLS